LAFSSLFRLGRAAAHSRHTPEAALACQRDPQQHFHFPPKALMQKGRVSFAILI
jgi:hypothetical protein